MRTHIKVSTVAACKPSEPPGSLKRLDPVGGVGSVLGYAYKLAREGDKLQRLPEASGAVASGKVTLFHRV